MSITHAMVLAAGRGERLRPLTDELPKPLLTVRGKPLIVYHLERLARLGVREVVINVSWLAARIRERLGDGAEWNLQLRYSEEEQALETGGGIFRALPWLGTAPFLVVNADVYSDFDLASLSLPPAGLARLVLVPNPPHNVRGDFALAGERLRLEGEPRWTYAGIGLYRAQLFEGCEGGKFPLLPLFRRAIGMDRLYGQLHLGQWSDVGTAERLLALQ
jgi:MurNAc alpha-1-phosphate uridylyltransferase